MQTRSDNIELHCLKGICGGHQVLLGFAPASVLFDHSFADVLNEDTGQGYQRPYSKAHSLDFKSYITKAGASTIPLTFNLREDRSTSWSLHEGASGTARLMIIRGHQCLARVDCQHRLGELKDTSTSLAFMTFIGLSLREEMAMFFVINSKAKGLCSSLTDYHHSNLVADIAQDAPHLYIAKRLNEDPDSPWFRLVRYGGETTSGLKRRTSLRMMQNSIYRFLRASQRFVPPTVDGKYELVLSFWKAVRQVFPEEWSDHRKHLITKGVGLYSLMLLLCDILAAHGSTGVTEEKLAQHLSTLKGKVDWTSKGIFSNAGGHKGASEVHSFLRRNMGL